MNFLKTFFKKEISSERKLTKSVTVYISAIQEQIIIVPCHINQAGAYFEQDNCTLLDYQIDKQTLGDEVIRNFNLFAWKDKNLRDYKSTDWPAFKCSKMKTVKSFKAAFVGVSIFGNNYSNIILCIEAPLEDEEKLAISASISANANKEDIGNCVMNVYHKSQLIK